MTSPTMSSAMPPSASDRIRRSADSKELLALLDTILTAPLATGRPGREGCKRKSRGNPGIRRAPRTGLCSTRTHDAPALSTLELPTLPRKCHGVVGRAAFGAPRLRRAGRSTSAARRTDRHRPGRDHRTRRDVVDLYRDPGPHRAVGPRPADGRLQQLQRLDGHPDRVPGPPGDGRVGPAPHRSRRHHGRRLAGHPARPVPADPDAVPARRDARFLRAPALRRGQPDRPVHPARVAGSGAATLRRSRRRRPALGDHGRPCGRPGL